MCEQVMNIGLRTQMTRLTIVASTGVKPVLFISCSDEFDGLWIEIRITQAMDVTHNTTVLTMLLLVNIRCAARYYQD